MTGREPLPAVRGMNDLLPPDSAKWQHFEARCRVHFERHGYREVRTPVLEHTALFTHGVGEATDIVEKQMYTFPDRKGRSLSMRPENTASCVRAYVEHGVPAREPVTRWYYAGPMFRYERVQLGRYRQFYQVGCEAFGIAEPTIDAEQIAMLFGLYAELAVPGLVVLLNTVGGPDDRPVYRAALVAYLEPQVDRLCADCRRRLHTNPLRILDCKEPGCREVVAGAPSILDHLGEASRAHIAAVQRLLGELGVPVQLDARLVRGLDYYSGTVFEVVSTGDTLGAQATVAAGGRYDGLVERLGGPATPAFGFAIGVERAVMCLPGEPAAFERPADLFLAALGDAARARALLVAHRLRAAGLAVEMEHRAVGLKAQLKRADRLGARHVVVLGDAELASGQVVLRDMRTRDERPVALDELASALAR